MAFCLMKCNLKFISFVSQKIVDELFEIWAHPAGDAANNNNEINWRSVIWRIFFHWLKVGKTFLKYSPQPHPPLNVTRRLLERSSCLQSICLSAWEVYQTFAWLSLTTWDTAKARGGGLWGVADSADILVGNMTRGQRGIKVALTKTRVDGDADKRTESTLKCANILSSR